MDIKDTAHKLLIAAYKNESMRKIAAKIGVNVSTVSRIIKGTQAPYPATAERIIKLYARN